MADQIVLAWTVDVSGTPLAPAGAAAKLAAVPLYQDANTDPILAQFFGLTVASDATTTGATTATRTLTLNMNGANSPEAPPVFPCHPDTSTPPTLPFKLFSTRELGGEFFVTAGSAVVLTTRSQLQTLAIGDVIQFLSQEGVPYEVLLITATQLTLTSVYTGTTGTTGAFEKMLAPVTRAAVFSTSPLDTIGVATTPAIPAGPGAQQIDLYYDDSAGGGPFVAEIDLTGKRPAAITLAVGSVDIAEIIKVIVAAPGSFANTVGQLTFVELSDALPAIPSNATRDDFQALTDDAQMLIDRAFAYVPPSYFALAQQGASYPQLAGDFLVTTGSKRVKTTADQTSALSAGNVIRFASQFTIKTETQTRDVFYTVAAVSPDYVTLEEEYSGIDENFTGNDNVNSNVGTKGNIGKSVVEKATGAYLIEPSPALPPTNGQLAAPLAQFAVTETVAPDGSVPAPTLLSDLYTRTLQLALAVPVVPSAITFLP